MRLGLILMSGSVRGDVLLAQRAERNGFATALTIEFFNRNGFVPLAAAAPQTSRIQLGTGIANAFTRAPLLLASAALDIDELSGGRMLLGLGSATRRMNEDWYGVPFSRPAARMRELVGLLRAVFAARGGGGFKFEGEFWKLNVPAYSRPNAARAEVPIWIAAVNRGMSRAAGACADALIGHPIATRRWHREVTLACIAEGEREAGRSPGACALAPYVLTSLAPTREEAVRNAKGQIGFYYTTDLYHSILEHHGLKHVGDACRAALKRFDTRAMAEAIPDALVDEIAIACTPDEASDRLGQWKDLTAEPLLYPPSVGVRPEKQRENLDMIFATLGDGRVSAGDENASAPQLFRRRWEANQNVASGVWAARRRLASAMRAVIERLITSDAPEAELERAAAQLESYASHLGTHPVRKRYVGFAESALADAQAEDAEGAAGGHFDFSPLIGRSNPLSPPILMSADAAGRVTGRVTFGSAYEGPPGCVHGGYVAAAFDEVLGFAETFSNAPGMTGTLNVVYRTPTPLHVEVVFTAQITRIQGRKIFVAGQLHAGERLCAECEAIFVSMKLGTFARLVEARAQRDSS